MAVLGIREKPQKSSALWAHEGGGKLALRSPPSDSARTRIDCCLGASLEFAPGLAPS